LSDKGRKKYVLWQTLVFLTGFLLDRTLIPALDAFGLAKIWLIDPTCGSGHFLLGGFARLYGTKVGKTTNGREPYMRLAPNIEAGTAGPPNALALGMN
jgi:hypothetical protein